MISRDELVVAIVIFAVALGFWALALSGRH